MRKRMIGFVLCMFLIFLCACSDKTAHEVDKDLVYDIPEHVTQPYKEINGNQPFFTDEEKTNVVFEQYASLDNLGRCGTAFACVGIETMPNNGTREDIASVFPTGWKNNAYDFVDQEYLYNRCHLIGYQLTAENQNERNLITGTRYLNIEGMLPFENQTRRYVRETGNHVLYRVTPIFSGENLVANGVLMEAWSIEDQGKGICFCIFAYNVQPGVEIDYLTGDNRLASNSTDWHIIGSQILKVYHKPDCPLANFVLVKVYFNTVKEAKMEGFRACYFCQ